RFVGVRAGRVVPAVAGVAGALTVEQRKAPAGFGAVDPYELGGTLVDDDGARLEVAERPEPLGDVAGSDALLAEDFDVRSFLAVASGANEAVAVGMGGEKRQVVFIRYHGYNSSALGLVVADARFQAGHAATVFDATLDQP